MNEKIKNFTDLIAWQKGHQLVLIIYKITKKFPKSETFSLSSQLQRAAISVTSNIAEGFSRDSNKEKLRFYYMSKGSLTEIQNQLIISKDLLYLKLDIFNKCFEETIIVQKLINGLCKKLKSNCI